MTVGFSGAEMVALAIQTEQSGYAFYRKAAEAARTETVREFCELMASQEAAHEATFRRMQRSVGEFSPPESYVGEWSAYGGALLASRVLPNAEVAAQLAGATTADVEAVDLAIRFEKDTILFMYEMRGHVPDGDAQTVDALIAEEKRHVQMLTEFRQSLR